MWCKNIGTPSKCMHYLYWFKCRWFQVIYFTEFTVTHWRSFSLLCLRCSLELKWCFCVQLSVEDGPQGECFPFKQFSMWRSEPGGWRVSWRDVMALMSETSHCGPGDSLNDRLCGLSISSSLHSEIYTVPCSYRATWSGGDFLGFTSKLVNQTVVTVVTLETLVFT